MGLAVVKLTASMPLADELLARRRALRAIDVAEARRDGVQMYVAAEDIESEEVRARVTRVAHDHPLLREHPGLFEPAMTHPAQKSLHDPVPHSCTTAPDGGRPDGKTAA